MRRPALLVVLLGLVAAAARLRGRARGDEREVWHEATVAPDLR